MQNKPIRLKRHHGLLGAVALLLAAMLLLAAVAWADGSIDGTNKWGWATSAGWVNLNATHGSVTVYDDHLEGYAWGENVGWIRLGSVETGAAHTYANDGPTTYGVNNDGCGNLTGYAWGTNIGWINFNPTHGQVTIDPSSGAFDGYGWSENVGWIHFSGTAENDNAYSVATNWRGSVAAAVAGIGVSGNQVDLDWAAVDNAESYNIYRSQNDPYFTPGTVHDTTTDLNWNEVSAGDPAFNHYYVVRVVGCGGAIESADSQRVGEFDFAIVPGV